MVTTSTMNLLATEVLNSRKPKQSCDVTAKSILFIKSRKSLVHVSDFEITPSVSISKVSPFDELRARTQTITYARDLVGFIAQERRQGYHDAVFAQLKQEVIYTASNFVNAYYNSHVIDSVNAIELAIVCVHLACKTQSAFKRLEKILIIANHFFKTRMPLDRCYFAEIEMQILQSIGFQLIIADDYPHRYIYQFLPQMSEKHESFKEKEGEMKMICTCALNLATTLVSSTPIMYNRESCHIAAACIYISNKFQHLLSIPEWWKAVPGCENFSEALLKDLADLIFDTIKYINTNWTYVEDFREKTSAFNSPQYPLSNVSECSMNGSPLLSMEAFLESPPHGGSSRGTSCDGSVTATVASGDNEDKLTGILGEDNGHLSPLARFINQKQYMFENSSTTSTCSSETISLGSAGAGRKILKIRRRSVAIPFSKPENVPFSKIKNLYPASPLVKTLPKLLPLNIDNKMLPSTTAIPKTTTSLLHSRGDRISPSLSTVEHNKIPESSPKSTTNKFPDLKPLTSTSIPDVCPDTPKANTPIVDHKHKKPPLSGHPLERNFRNRINALRNSKEVMRFYAGSKEEYSKLSREEKDLVKRFTVQMKQNKEKKKRRHSDICHSGKKFEFHEAKKFKLE